MNDEWQRLTSIFSNSFGAVTELLMMMLAVMVLVHNRHRLSRDTVAVVAGIAALGLGGLFRIGWWLPGLYLASPNQAYHAFFIENRWISYGVGMPLMAIGITLIIAHIFQEHRRAIWMTLVGGFVASLMITYSFHLSEVGVWDRAVVIEAWDKTFPYDSAFERVIIRGD